MTMTLTQALSATRMSTRRPEEYDAVLMQHYALIEFEKNDKAQRRLVALGCALFAVMFVGVLIANMREYTSMTNEQRATIEHIIN